MNRRILAADFYLIGAAGGSVREEKRVFGIKRRLSHVYPVQLQQGSGLHDVGWSRSVRTKAAVDGRGSALPWYTYPAIEFLQRRVPACRAVFEFGCGNSSLWWAQRSAKVWAVEHDPTWAENIRRKAPSNLQIRHVPLDETHDYQSSCLAIGERFQVIVIDGRRRVECAKSAALALSDDGVIVWDNSERTKYAEGYQLLSDKGFRRVDFWGMGPINLEQWCTSIFYRDANILCL